MERQEELERVEQFAEEALRGLPEPLRSAAQELLVTVSHEPGADLYGEFYGLLKGMESGLGDPRFGIRRGHHSLCGVVLYLHSLILPAPS